TVEALLTAKAPAKATSKAKSKGKPKAAPKPATKGSRAVGKGSGLSRKDWNKTLVTRARFAGKKGGESVYSQVISRWAEVQGLRNEGLTPDEVLAQLFEV